MPLECIDFFIAQFLQHSKEYLEILAAVKGVGKEKILASQFITRFFKNFPDYSHEAIEALLDLCEDEDVVVSLFLDILPGINGCSGSQTSDQGLAVHLQGQQTLHSENS